MNISGAQIVDLRKKLKLTQQEFADQINYSRSYLSDIEIGKVKPSRRFLEAVSERYGISLDSLAENSYEDWINYLVTCTEEDFFIFIFGFNTAELCKGEIELMLYLANMDHVSVDASEIKSYSGLLSAIMEKEYNKDNGPVQKQYGLFAQESEHFFIFLKNFSKSKIPKKEQKLKQLINDSCHQTIIVLDKPSFLEKYSDELYSYARVTHA